MILQTGAFHPENRCLRSFFLFKNNIVLSLNLLKLIKESKHLLSQNMGYGFKVQT